MRLYGVSDALLALSANGLALGTVGCACFCENARVDFRCCGWFMFRFGLIDDGFRVSIIRLGDGLRVSLLGDAAFGVSLLRDDGFGVSSLRLDDSFRVSSLRLGDGLRVSLLGDAGFGMSLLVGFFWYVGLYRVGGDLLGISFCWYMGGDLVNNLSLVNSLNGLGLVNSFVNLMVLDNLVWCGDLLCCDGFFCCGGDGVFTDALVDVSPAILEGQFRRGAAMGIQFPQ